MKKNVKIVEDYLIKQKKLGNYILDPINIAVDLDMPLNELSDALDALKSKGVKVVGN